MASTRNKNTTSDYQLQQFEFQKLRDYDSYLGKVVNTNTCLPGNGLLAGKMPSMTLSRNYTNIESDLFGIGSTNLVTSKPPVIPIFKTVRCLDIYDKDKVLMPQPLIIEKYQRPSFLH